MTRLQVFLGAVSLVVMVLTLELARRRQLREKYALLWLTVAVGVLVLGWSRGTVDALSLALGIAYGPTTLFLFGILFLLLVVAHLTYEVSRLEDRSRRLAEEIGLLTVRQAPPPDGERDGGAPPA